MPASMCSTILLEQPVMHLHPGVQAGLTDLFLRALTMREGNDPRSGALPAAWHRAPGLSRWAPSPTRS